MITRLFRTRPRLDSKAPEDRRRAIEALSEQEALKVQAELARLAQEDDDPAVRRTAICQLHTEKVLRELLADSKQADQAVERIVELNTRGKCMGLSEEPVVLAAQLSTTSEPGTLAARLIEMGGHSLLIDALLGAPRERRETLLSLPQLGKTDLLQELERRSRDRDKKTNRFARARLDEVRKQVATATAVAEEVAERLSNLEKPGDDSALERERRSVLLGRVEQSLQELESLSRQLAATGAALPDLAALAERHRRLAQHSAGHSPKEQPQTRKPAGSSPAEATSPEIEPTPAPQADFDTLTAGFQGLDEALTTSTDFDALAAERQRLTDLWLAAADHTPPADSQHRVFEQVSHRFQLLAEANRRLQGTSFRTVDPGTVPDRIDTATDQGAWRAAAELESAVRTLQKTLDHINWPDWATVPEGLATQRTLLKTATARLESWQRSEAQTLTDLAESLEKLDALIESGELKTARSEAGRIRKGLKPIPERSARELNRHLARASARLSELSDWQTFATTPKREALLAAMTEIADNPLAPPDQASRIKSLRKEWNALGPLGRSDDHKLLDAFNEVAERAFEPCRAHFAEQADIRTANLAAREAICESLAGYLAATDWQHADFKAAERIMRTARDEWRAHHPVDRSAGKAVEDRFESLQADLHQHIKTEWDRNLQAKRQIVEEAKALLAGDQGIVDQVEGAKRLQQRWKSIGTTPRRPDQTLWREFRAACDAIFEKRDSVKQSEDAEIRANRQTAEQLLAEFRARLDEASDPIDPGTLREFQNQFAELPPLPDRLARALDREQSELVRAAQQVLRDQRAAAAVTRLENLKSQDAEVSALEQLQQAGETVAFTPPDPVFASRCQAGATPVASEALTRLVLEAEIAAGLESAETDLKISLQVEMMNAGRGREALEATPEDLTRRWCELGPKDESADPLRERLFTAITVLIGR